MKADTPLLQTRGLTVSHRHTGRSSQRSRQLEAVHQLDLSLHAGEILAIVGESGSGKSSLARALLGLLPAASGAVYFRGSDIAAMDKPQRRQWHREIQLLFQDPHSALSPRRRIQRTLEEALQQQGKDGSLHARQRIPDVLNQVNLPADVLQRFPHQLSGGQKQRIALARALLCEPALVIADEPFSALDVSEQARMLQMLRRLRAEKGIAVLLVAHDLGVVQQIADRVGVMYLGRLVELAPAGQFFSHAAHPYSQALVQAGRNSWSQDHSGVPVLEGEAPSALAPPKGCVFHPRCPQKLECCPVQVPADRVLPFTGDAGPLHRVQCHLYAGQQELSDTDMTGR